MATLFTSPKFRAWDADGNPLAGGKVHTYAAGTTTPKVTYTTQAGSVENTNPVILDASGQANIWLGSGSYKFVVTKADDSAAPDGTVDNITGGPDATAVEYTPPGSGSVARSVFSVLREKRKLTDKLTTAEIDDILAGTASIDIAAKFRTALSDAAGKLLLLPYGVINIGSALTITSGAVWVEGQGAGTRIVSSNTTADLFTLGNGTDEISGLYFSNFDTWASVTKSAGYVFNARRVTDSRWEAVRVGTIDLYVANASAHRLYNGVYHDRFSQVAWIGGEIVCSNDGFVVRGNTDQSFGAEVSISDGMRIFGCGGKGVYLGGGAGGVYLGRMDVSSCRRGVVCDDTLATTFNRELFILGQCTIDSCPGTGVQVDSNGLAILDAHGLWVSGCGTTTEPAVWVKSAGAQTVSANWAGARIQSNVFDGVRLESGAHTFSGGFCRNNGTGATEGHGFDLVGFSALAINGMAIHNNGGGTRGRGVKIAAAQDNFAISGNNFFSNGQSALENAAGSGTTKVIASNTGLVTQNVGSATVLSGTSSIVVSHGLYAAPSAVFIQEAGTMDAGQYAYVAPSSYTSTQFTITLSGSAAANRDFVWRAVVGVQ